MAKPVAPYADDEEVPCEHCHGMGGIEQMLDDEEWYEECRSCGGAGFGYLRKGIWTREDRNERDAV